MRAKMIPTILMLFFFIVSLTGLSFAGEREDRERKDDERRIERRDDRRDDRRDERRDDRRDDREDFFEGLFEDFFFDDDFFFGPRFPVFAPGFFRR
ncbi:MAG: hypothetical protein EHM36_13285 [Deltaproteobacteria bacterium]|nr:MAG: hypothetical protein EHM36_13285 [Deltaproteobacteria bacterium]